MTIGLKTQALRLRDHFVEEALRALNMSTEDWPGRIVAQVLRTPAQRLAEIVEGFDHLVGQFGLLNASHWALTHFTQDVEVHGAKHVPASGPLLITANHPGMVDALVITAHLPRPDLKIVISAMPIFTKLQAMKEHLIYCTRNTYERLTVVRSAARHLRQGGAILIFPRGTIEPDPAVLDGAIESLEGWSPSIEIMLRMVPQTAVLVTVVSGVLSSHSLRNPLTWLGKEIGEKQKIAEILQAIQHLLFPRTLAITPHLRFGPPFAAADVLGQLQKLSPMEAIRNTARSLLTDT